MSAPQVSILIPCYNAERWIGQAIDSALTQSDAQAGLRTEVIVIDDGSTDGSRAIIENFGTRITAVFQKNAGSNPTRNRLLEMSSGTWIQYLDADDYLMPGKIAGQWALLNDTADVDVLYGPDTVEWHDDREPRSNLHEIPEPRDPWMLLALWRLPQTGAPLWRRAALEDVEGWREAQPCCQEHELYLRLMIAGKRFVYAPAGGAVYRRFATGTLSTSNQTRVRTERAKIIVRLEAHLADAGLLTPERQWAIDQARFDMARSAWPVDRAEARRLHGAIRSRGFRPRGAAAPGSYQLAYRALGFEPSEWIAAMRRSVTARRNSKAPTS